MEPGDFATVIAGRKVPHGTTGLVFWSGNTDWGFSYGLLLPSAERVFLKHTQVVGCVPSAEVQESLRFLVKLSRMALYFRQQLPNPRFLVRTLAGSSTCLHCREELPDNYHRAQHHRRRHPKR